MSPSTEIEGLVLTRQCLDRPHADGTERNQILLWLATADGPVQVQLPFEPLCFYILQSQQAQALTLWQQHGIHGRIKAGSLLTFRGARALTCQFASLTLMHKARELLNLHGLTAFETDIRHVDRVLMERFITSRIRVSGSVRVRKGHRFCIAESLEPGTQPVSLACLSLDVECAPDGALYAIGLQCRYRDLRIEERVILIGQPEPVDCPVEWVADERALLVAAGRFIQRADPDLIIGWNVINFDFQLLLQRATLLSVPLQWGRMGSLMRWRPSSEDDQRGQVFIPGRVVLDGIALLKTATWQFESFSLDSVARTLFSEGKLMADPDDRLQEIQRLFREDKPALACYNLQDCRLVTRIFDHCQLIEFACLRSQLTGLELDRPGGSVAAFSYLYLPRLHQRGYVAPSLGEVPGASSPGGVVMDSRPGLYRDVLVLDFKSLYPSIIRTFAIDPLGLILGEQADLPDCAPSQGPVPGFLGARFAREHPILPGLIADLWQARDAAKSQGNAPLSQAIKILMNSFYGVLGSMGCRFFDPRLASSITMRGHWIMQQTRQQIEAAGFQVIYGDTDSLFVWLSDPAQAARAAELGPELVVRVNAWWRARLNSAWGLDSCLELQYERHYRRFFMPTIRGTDLGSKKRYAGLEGEGEQARIIFKGLETVRTDWTELAKQFQRGLYERIFRDEEPGPFIADMLARTRQGELDDWLVYRKRLRRKLSDYDKTQPPHVRAARLADEARLRAGLMPRYQRRGTIAYVITTQGPEPLEAQQHALDYEHYIDKQLRPVAEAILPLIGRRFDEWADEQLSLF